MYRHIAINGELGSGKSTIGKQLAEELDMRYVSTGDIHRSIAASLELSTLETNLRAEHDAMIDERVDGVTIRLARSEDPVVFDSRLAWKFVDTAFKVHLVVDPAVSARRLHGRQGSVAEAYLSVEDAERGAEERYQSEYRRFLSKYDADVSFLKNYHLVIDTSDATVDDVVSLISEGFRHPTLGPLILKLSPRRVLPGIKIGETAETGANWKELTVGYARPFFFFLEGYHLISNALRDGRSLVDAVLVAEGKEEVMPGVSAADFVNRDLSAEIVAGWELMNGIRYETRPVHLA